MSGTRTPVTLEHEWSDSISDIAEQRESTLKFRSAQRYEFLDLAAGMVLACVRFPSEAAAPFDGHETVLVFRPKRVASRLHVAVCSTPSKRSYGRCCVSLERFVHADRFSRFVTGNLAAPGVPATWRDALRRF